jgi:23S rRNA (adenine1618-N6)-methyltransferase
MIEESLLFKTQVCWFTCLVSKNSNLNPLKKYLANQPITEMKVVEMSQGHKISRFIAWTFLTGLEQKQFLAK